MDNKTWLLYGANGYSGERAVRAARKLGRHPVLAGRNELEISRLANELDLPYRVFALDDITAIREQLWDIAVVVHAAGPFSKTSEPMIQACVASGVHYVDITGEVSVFERAQQFDREARKAGVVVCPGVGFDVIPTDCIAAVLHEQLADAHTLALGFHGNLRPSRGTAKTALEGVAKGIFVRRQGELQSVPRDYQLRQIDFGNGRRRSAVIPWGDISTAFWTTKIPNISVYIPDNRSLLSMKLFGLQKFLLSLPPVNKLLIKKINDGARGPAVKDGRSEGGMYVWGEVRNAAGRVIEARLQTANGYDVTVEGMLRAATHLQNYGGRGGYFTPSQLFGNRIIEQFEGSSAIEISESQA
ncbi:MAG: saccharopine dehydrogenase NADP-binding domain-containing protein [Woeseia sp.]